MKYRYLTWLFPMIISAGLSIAADSTVDKDGWLSLFDGKALGKWKPSNFHGNGKIEVKDGMIMIGSGKPMSGIVWSNEPPARMNYEIQLEAMRTEGNDFFCGLTFPVGTNPCTLVVGGWGGSVTGLSSIDGFDASENETSTSATYSNNRWYRIRVKVTKSRIEAWIDDKQIVDLDTTNRRISVRWEVEESIPLGIATWCTGSAVRNIRVRKFEW
jgi:hypothetical protein